jgi:hypothetical protein
MYSTFNIVDCLYIVLQNFHMNLILNIFSANMKEELARKTRDIQRMTAEINELRYNPTEHMIKEHGYQITNDYTYNKQSLEPNVEYCEPQDLKTEISYDNQILPIIINNKPFELETFVLFDNTLQMEANVIQDEPLEMETNVVYDEPPQSSRMSTYYQQASN